MNENIKNKSVTVVISAYCEIKNLEPAYESVFRILGKAGISDYEIIIVTNTRRDGSDDGTPVLAARLAKENERTRSIHNNSYVGLGYKYRQAAKVATKDYIMPIPGSNEFDEDSVVRVLDNVGRSEMIITYNNNPETRELKRRFISRGFTLLCNGLFGLNLKYYNGMNILPVKYLQKIPAKCDDFAYMAENLIYLVKSGVSYSEVSWDVKPAIGLAVLHSAFNLRTVLETLNLGVLTPAALEDSVNPSMIALLVVLLILLIALQDHERMLIKGLLFIAVVYGMYFLHGIGYLNWFAQYGYFFPKSIGVLAIILGISMLKQFFGTWNVIVRNLPEKSRTIIPAAIQPLFSVYGIIILALVSTVWTYFNTGRSFAILRLLFHDHATRWGAFPLLLYHHFIIILPMLIVLLFIYFVKKKWYGYFDHKYKDERSQAEKWKRHTWRLINFGLSMVLIVIGIILVF